MTKRTIDELLDELGQSVGMPCLKLDVAGCCQLLFDQRWLVTLMSQSAASRIMLHCPISSTQSAQGVGTSTLRAMLEANFMGRGTGRCELSICTEGRVCLLLQVALVETDSSALVHAIEQLLNQAETWSQWLQREFESPAVPLSLQVRSRQTQPEPAQNRQPARDWLNQRV